VAAKKNNDAWVAEQANAPDLGAFKRQIASLQAENARLRQTLNLVEDYKVQAADLPAWADKKRKYKPAEAILHLQLSDLHLDEVVNPEEMAGTNAYDREIARLRLRRWVDKACELGDRYKHVWQGIYIYLGGDLVSGAIHEELAETNESSLPQTLLYWAPELAAAIRDVSNHFGVPVAVWGVVGNHGRLTKKKTAKKRALNSWDMLLMELVRMHLQSEKNITWELAKSSFLSVPIFDRHIFLTHGDEAGGGSGWSGIWTPLMTIHRKGSEMCRSLYRRSISYSVIGHWHQSIMAHLSGICCNGSLKGYDEFAMGYRFLPQPAIQNMWVETAGHGVTLYAPLYLEDRKREGW
jgi:hypothetical protein